jgi:hypothetical protein
MEAERHIGTSRGSETEGEHHHGAFDGRAGWDGAGYVEGEQGAPFHGASRDSREDVFSLGVAGEVFGLVDGIVPGRGEKDSFGRKFRDEKKARENRERDRALKHTLETRYSHAHRKD